MKAVKISLAIIVIAAIAYFTIQAFVSTDEVGDIQQGTNPFVEKIKQEIGEMTQKPDDKFCKDYYTEVVYHIDDYHKNSKFSNNPSDNDQWKNNLSKQLYSAYADKFIKQAFYVFNRSEWSNSDLSFIRKEYKALQSSSLLQIGSPVDQKFNEIQAIFHKYDEIKSFIASCKNFSYSDTGLNSQFPIGEVSGLISQAHFYKRNNLGDGYVNNCSLLHEELNVIPLILFNTHVRYLDNLINYWSGMYSNYNSQRAYVDNLYRPIDAKIDELDNELYDVSNFSDKYWQLKQRWEVDATNAYNYLN